MVIHLCIKSGYHSSGKIIVLKGVYNQSEFSLGHSFFFQLGGFSTIMWGSLIYLLYVIILLDIIQSCQITNKVNRFRE